MAAPAISDSAEAVSVLMMSVLRLEDAADVLASDPAKDHLRAAWTALYDARKALEEAALPF